MTAKLLLTAFQPFGLKGLVSGQNISKQVCDALARERGGDVQYVVLDVGPAAETQLSVALAEEPGGVLLSGEDLSLLTSPARVEPRAYNPGQQLGLNIPKLVPWGVLSFRLPWARSLSSNLAEQAAAAAGGRRAELREHIGTFWCNRMYYRALEWGQAQARPVLFVHLGVFGQFQEKLSAMRAILDLMLKRGAFDRLAAAQYATVHAATSYEEAKQRGGGQTWCARHVRQAIQAGGINLEATGLAKDYGPKLLAAGFEEISAAGYTPVSGDVIVFQGIPASPPGHMQIFDGQQWVSDFKQADKLFPSSAPGSPWRKAPYRIYRYPL